MRKKTEKEVSFENGYVYLFLESRPEKIFDICLARMEEKGEGLVITGGHMNKLAH